MNNEEKINKLEQIRNKLFEEDDELCKKIIKLEAFINSNRITKISREQVNLLEVQFQAMRTYHQVLRARIIDLHKQIVEGSK